jgi:RimJ/RimL family protein N-acetyltransferase
MNLHVPVVETARLRLRGHRPEDFLLSCAMWYDAAVMRYIGGRPLSQEDAWTRLLRSVGHWALFGYGYWAIETRDSGEYVGDLGFMNAKRDIDPPLGDAPEIGWVLTAHAHGKGYATEAALAAVEWGDREFGPVPTVCLIHPENHASLRVAAKCGYRESHRTSYKEHPTVVLARGGAHKK